MLLVVLSLRATGACGQVDSIRVAAAGVNIGCCRIDDCLATTSFQGDTAEKFHS
jgi:hypothetical protein